MSRVGKHEVMLPAGVVMTQEGRVLTLKGKTGSKTYEVPECINFEKTEKGFLVTPKEKHNVVVHFGVQHREIYPIS